MENKFTPAPWVLESTGNGWYRIKGSPLGPMDESQANAHLIAAAPDLLAALQDLWPLATNAFGELSIDEVTADPILNQLSIAIDKSKTAISKALNLKK